MLILYHNVKRKCDVSELVIIKHRRYPSILYLCYYLEKKDVVSNLNVDVDDGERETKKYSKCLVT